MPSGDLYSIRRSWERRQSCDDIANIFFFKWSDPFLFRWFHNTMYLSFINPLAISFSRMIIYLTPQLMVVVAGVILGGNCHLSVYCMHFSGHFIHIIHNLQEPHEAVTLTHILSRKKMKPREVSSFAPGHSASRWRGGVWTQQHSTRHQSTLWTFPQSS